LFTLKLFTAFVLSFFSLSSEGSSNILIDQDIVNIAKIFEIHEGVTAYNVSPTTDIKVLLRNYAESEYGSPLVVNIVDYKNEIESPTVNAPYLLSISTLNATLGILAKELALLAERKQIKAKKRKRLLKRIKKITYALERKNFKFAFDGGAENRCEAPVRRLIVYKPLGAFAYSINLEEC
jgi:hypothetical protein